MEEKTPEQIQKEKDREEFRKILTSWHTAIKNAGLYDQKHPAIMQASQNMAGLLAEIFKFKLEINIRHIDGIFVVEEVLLIEESIILYDLLHLLEKSTIALITFLPGITGQDLKDFVLFLNKYAQKEEINEAPKAFSNDHVRAVLSSKEGTMFNVRTSKRGRFNQYAEIFKSWEGTTEKIFEQLLSEQNFSMGAIAEPLDDLIDVIQLDPETITASFVKPLTNLNIDHSIRTMILSIIMGKHIGLNIATTKSLAVGALLHDIGRFLLPSEFTSGYKLLDEDIPFIQLHAKDGAAFLTGVEGLPISTLRVALEHHVGFDGIGYPQLPENHKIHFFSQIVGLADFVSWGTLTENYYQKTAPLHKIVRSVIRRSGSQFNPILVKIFAPIFGIYPPGTKVRFASGKQGLSLETNSRNIIRPRSCSVESEGQGTYIPLSDFSTSNPHEFNDKITHILGSDTNIEPYLDTIPDTLDGS